MKKFTTLAGILALTTFSLPASADVITLDFESYGNHSDVVTNFEFGTIRANRRLQNGRLVSTDAVIFDSNQRNTRDSDLEGPFERQSNLQFEDLGNLLIIQETPGGEADDNAYGGQIIFDFNIPVRLTSFDLIDVNTVDFSVLLFDTFDNFLGRRVFRQVDLNTNQFGENLFDTFNVGIDNIGLAIFDFGRNSGAIDNIVLTIPYQTTSEVPIPAAALLFLTGLTGFAFARRK